MWTLFVSKHNYLVVVTQEEATGRKFDDAFILPLGLSCNIQISVG